jgi:hypothetical protein
LGQGEGCCHVPFLAIFARRPVETGSLFDEMEIRSAGVGQNRPLRLVVSRAFISHGVSGGPSGLRQDAARELCVRIPCS